MGQNQNQGKIDRDLIENQYTLTLYGVILRLYNYNQQELAGHTN